MEVTALRSNTTEHVADMTMKKETMAIRTAVGFVKILLTLLLAKLWLDFLKPWIQSVTKEKMMAKQGVPILPGKSFLEGHGHLERKINQESGTKPQNPGDPHNIASRIVPFHTFCSSICGKTFVYWKGREVTLHTQDPNILKEAFVTKPKDFQRNQMQIDQLESLVGKSGLVISEGTNWAHQRKLVSPAFRAEKLKEMVKPMLVSINTVMDKWEKSVEEGQGTAEIDVTVDIALITADILCQTSFGTTYEKGQQYFAMLQELLPYTTQRYATVTIPGLSMLPTAQNRRIWKLEKEMKSVLEDILFQLRRLAARKEGSYGDDLLGLMLEASEGEEPKYRFTNDELIDQVKTFFFAGQETTAVLLTWAMMLLATYLDWQEKAYDEVESCSGGKPLDFDSVGKLRIVNMILNEALRLYPPAIWLQRQSQKDLLLGKLFIPKGMSICFNILAMHHDPDLWAPDANAFNPDRFVDGPAKLPSTRRRSLLFQLDLAPASAKLLHG